MSQGVSYGAWVTIGNADVCDILQRLPFDFLVFDMEHSPVSAETVSHMIQVLDEEIVSPIVRVGANDQYLIKAALDMGAHGVIVPLVSTADDAAAAAAGADVLYTDVWVSMGREAEEAERLRELAPYQLNDDLLAQARPGALVLHCLPAYRGKEITEEVLERHAQTIFDQAENRLHAQKAILQWVVR